MACLETVTGVLCLETFCSWVVQVLPIGEVMGIPGLEIGMKTFPFGPTVIGLCIDCGD